MAAGLLALLTVSLVAFSTAAPSAERALGRVRVAAAQEAVRGDRRRRAKREVLLEEAPALDEQDILEEQLSQLSDDQLEGLAELVQSELEKYQRPEEFEIVEVPEELLLQAVAEAAAEEGDDGVDDVAVDYVPRDRRAVLVEEDEDEAGDEEPQLLVVPDEVVEEALAEDLQDDLELRMRIVELANILNERVSRRSL